MDDSIEIVRDIFNNFEFHHLLVLENQKLAGVISDRDFLKTLSPFLDTPSQKRRDFAILKKKAHQIMSRTLLTIDAETSIEEAGNLLLENNISCLPVISPQGSVEGIVTCEPFQFTLNKQEVSGSRNNSAFIFCLFQTVSYLFYIPSIKAS
jgi:acetoin utilization protein AcuB